MFKINKKIKKNNIITKFDLSKLDLKTKTGNTQKKNNKLSFIFIYCSSGVTNLYLR